MKESISAILNELTDKELDEVTSTITRIRGDRNRALRKELWSNVQAAIKKYCEVTGEDIECIHPYDSDGILCIESLDNPGMLYIAI